MRLRNFGRHDPEAPDGRDAGWRLGGVMDVAVWKEFGSDRRALAAEVAKIRRSITSREWNLEVRSSHGPVPSFALRSSEPQDGPTGVYLLLVDGPLALLAPGRINAPGWMIVKVGRSANLERRMAELASGLPPCSAIHYVPIAFRMFSAGREAHGFEREILDLCDVKGWALGGEFAYAPIDGLKRRFGACKA